MATNRNIQMNYFNGTDYDSLYPQTNMSLVSGLSKEISNINSQFSTVNNSIARISTDLENKLSVDSGLQKVFLKNVVVNFSLTRTDNEKTTNVGSLDFSDAKLILLETNNLIISRDNKYFNGSLCMNFSNVGLLYVYRINQSVTQIISDSFYTLVYPVGLHSISPEGVTNNNKNYKEGATWMAVQNGFVSDTEFILNDSTNYQVIAIRYDNDTDRKQIGISCDINIYKYV